MVINSKITDYANLGRYLLIELAEGKHEVVASISAQSIRVVLQSNSSHRAWRGMGKVFSGETAALEHYKTGAVRSMVAAAIAAARDAGIEVRA